MRARAGGALRLSLRTARDDSRAQRVYERNGWKRDEKLRQYDFAL
jgi:RimJ/RimL family protein N-acetyltransferase